MPRPIHRRAPRRAPRRARGPSDSRHHRPRPYRWTRSPPVCLEECVNGRNEFGLVDGRVPPPPVFCLIKGQLPLPAGDRGGVAVDCGDLTPDRVEMVPDCYAVFLLVEHARLVRPLQRCLPSLVGSHLLFGQVTRQRVQLLVELAFVPFVSSGLSRSHGYSCPPYSSQASGQEASS